LSTSTTLDHQSFLHREAIPSAHWEDLLGTKTSFLSAALNWGILVCRPVDGVGGDPVKVFMLLALVGLELAGCLGGPSI
jgi:hypothetical protein